MVRYESLLERDFIYLLNFDPTITSYNAHPFRIYYDWEGKQRYYTPDFFVEKEDRYYVIECKPQIFVDEASDEDLRKWDAAREWCHQEGATFVIATDTEIRSGFRLKNIELLNDHAHFDVSIDLKARVFALLNHGDMTVAELMISIAPSKPQTAIMPILHLARHHKIFIPIDDEPITTDSIVSLFRPKNQLNKEYFLC